MDKKNDNPLARFERRSSAYAMTIVGVVTFLCLTIGIGMSVQAQLWPAVVVMGIAIAALVVFIALNINRNRRLTGARERKLIKWDAALPELQRQNVNLEVKELARLLGVESDSMPDLLSAYIVAEDLALRQIQQEEKLPLMRHVQLGSTPFDAIMLEQDLITCIEVSFLVVPELRQDKIEAVLKKISVAKRTLANMKVRVRLHLMLVLVTQLTDEEEELLRGMLITRRFTDTPVDIDIRMLDFESLQKIYLTD